MWWVSWRLRSARGGRTSDQDARMGAQKEGNRRQRRRHHRPSKAKAIRHRPQGQRRDAGRGCGARAAHERRGAPPIPRSGAVANREPLRWDGTDGARRSVRNKFRGHNAHAVDTTYTRCTCSTEKLTAKATHAYGVEATRRRYAATLTRAVQSQRRGRTHTHAHACTHMLPARR